MDHNKTETLYGIGVGPGDPDLITMKAIKILGRVDMIFAASSTKNSHSQAVDIARPHIPADTPIKRLPFPMTRDKVETTAAWEENALSIMAELQRGKNAAFLTLGDAMTYSTYGYVLKHIKAIAPDLNIVSVPGITSYQASAARLNTPLVEGEESLMVVSGVQGGGRFRRLGAKPENVVFLKAYKNVKDISEALEESDLLENSVGVARCGLPEEEIIHDVKALGSRPPGYWTLIIAKQTSRNGSQKDQA